VGAAHVVHGGRGWATGQAANTDRDAVDEGTPSHDGAIFNNIVWRDKNAEWLTWYAFTTINSAVSYYASKDFHYKLSEIGFNALPFYGTGATARKVGVAVTGSSAFVSVASATASGAPGNEVSGALATKRGNKTWELAWAKVDVKLKAGKEYFLAVSCPQSERNCNGGWYMELDDLSGGATDYWHVKEHETYNFGTSCPSGTYCHDHTYSFSSPWRLSDYYPEQGAAIIK
jgi:hypothetical protein